MVNLLAADLSSLSILTERKFVIVVVLCSEKVGCGRWTEKRCNNLSLSHTEIPCLNKVTLLVLPSLTVSQRVSLIKNLTNYSM